MKKSQNFSLLISIVLTASVFYNTHTSSNKQNVPAQCITAEIAYGELVDKITILKIKQEKITDPKKLENVTKELKTLQQSFNEAIEPSKKLNELASCLRRVNESLWNIEDALRDKERVQEFDEKFIELARSVYVTNDERCHIKRAINTLLGSEIMEEKSYSDYTPQKIQ